MKQKAKHITVITIVLFIICLITGLSQQTYAKEQLTDEQIRDQNILAELQQTIDPVTITSDTEDNNETQCVKKEFIVKTPGLFKIEYASGYFPQDFCRFTKVEISVNNSVVTNSDFRKRGMTAPIAKDNYDHLLPASGNSNILIYADRNKNEDRILRIGDKVTIEYNFMASLDKFFGKLSITPDISVNNSSIASNHTFNGIITQNEYISILNNASEICKEINTILNSKYLNANGFYYLNDINSKIQKILNGTPSTTDVNILNEQSARFNNFKNYHTVKISLLPGEGKGNVVENEILSFDEYTLPNSTFTTPVNKEFSKWKIGDKEYSPGEKVHLSKDTEINAVYKNKSSNTKSANKQKTTPPDKVMSFSVKSSNKKAVLKWKKAKNATDYAIYKAKKKNGKYKLIKTTNKTKYTDKKVKKNKTYFYKIKSIRKVNDKVIYSSFSTVKKLKIK